MIQVNRSLIIVAPANFRRLLLWLLLANSSTVLAGITFEEVPGPFKEAEAWGASWGDYNNDRCPDLFVNHHREGAAIYKNNCDGTFKNTTSKVDIDRTWQDGNTTSDQHGATWGDFDNDGDQDLYVTTGARWDGQLLMNENGVLHNRTADSGIVDDKEGRMSLLFDYDRDGILDMLMHSRTQSWSLLQDSASPGLFMDTRNLTLFKATQATNYGHLIDLNGDDSLDYLGGPEGTFPTAAYDMSTLPFRNIKSNIQTVGPVVDSEVADFNGDSKNDVLLLRGRLRPFQAKQFGPNLVEGWITSSAGNGRKSFQFVAPNGDLNISAYWLMGLVNFNIGASGYKLPSSAKLSSSHFSFALSASDPENHGIKPHDPASASDRGVYIGYDPASQQWQFSMVHGGQYTTGYFVVNSSSTISNLTTTGREAIDGPLTPTMLLNNGKGFEGATLPLTAATSASLGDLGKAVGCVSVVAADFDNDMDLDAYFVCTGGVENTANLLYANRGTGQFDLVTNAGGAQGPVGSSVTDKLGLGDSVVVADYDGDGRQDLYVTNGLQLFPVRYRTPDQLYRNTTVNSNHWIELDLAGTLSNRDGVGAKVYATAGGVTQLREQNGHQHRWSQNHQRIHFGLGQNATVDLRIVWPSGTVQTFENLNSNRLYEIREDDSGSVHPVSLGPVAADPLSPGLSVLDLSVSESVVNASIPVMLNPANPNPVTVTYMVKPGTALGGSDYRYRTGTLTFNPGETSKLISVPIINDTAREPAESFSIRLSNAIGASIGQANGFITILDDD